MLFPMTLSTRNDRVKGGVIMSADVIYASGVIKTTRVFIPKCALMANAPPGFTMAVYHMKRDVVGMMTAH